MVVRSNEIIQRYQRLDLDDAGVYVYPEYPDWFVPSKRADRILQLLKSGKSIYESAKADSEDKGQSVEKSDFAIRRFLERLTKPEHAPYKGRSCTFSVTSLKECWFHLTNNCNQRCTHCLFSSGPTEEARLSRGDLIDSIEEVLYLGCNIFYFTGGEPFVYEGLTEICDQILEKSSAHIVNLTNAIMIKNFSGWLEKADRQRLHFQVSIDGLEDVHDSIRGQGSFSKTIANTRFLTDIGYNATLAMTVTKDNVSQMEELIDLASSLGVKSVHYIWLFQKGREHGQDIVSARDILACLFEAYLKANSCGVLVDNVEIIKSQVFSLPGTKFDLSNTAWQSLAIGPDGRIYPSPALIGERAMAAGHVCDGIGKIWKNSTVLDIVRRASLVDNKAYARNPLRFLVGGGDIDHSFMSGGKLTGCDPYVEIYNGIVLRLLADQYQNGSREDSMGLFARMGERLYECGEDIGEVAFTHSNCVLSLPGKDGHTLVKVFYSAAAETPKEEIFNPVHYDESDVSHIPEEARIRSYGCGSPIFDCDLKEGEVLVDLGCGTGVECFMAARKAGSTGRAIGIDMSEQMLSIAENARPEVAEKLGFENVEFRKGLLEDVPVNSNSADAVISNCVINLSPDKRRTFLEIYRILKCGGRLVISDIAYEGEIPLSVKYNEKLRGECIGGAFKEEELFGLLEDVGFEAARIIKRYLYRQVAGHDFYSITYSARKPCQAEKKNVMYRGPFASVLTDRGHLLRRGVKTELPLSKDFPVDDSLFVIDDQGIVTNVEQTMTCGCFIAPSQMSRTSKTAPVKHKSGCMVCGAELIYRQDGDGLRCYFCGTRTYATAVCQAGHFVCDSCHAVEAISIIARLCLSSGDTDMIGLMQRIRSHPSLPLHGPEYHCLVPAVVLTVYRNTIDSLDDKHIQAGIERGKTVAGGACAFMGICGAAVGVGIAFSIITEADPYKARQRQVVQRAVAEIAGKIGQYEAARCCQRDSYIALKEAARLSKECLGAALNADKDIECSQHLKNSECIQGRCPLWPGGNPSAVADHRLYKPRTLSGERGALQ